MYTCQIKHSRTASRTTTRGKGESCSPYTAPRRSASTCPPLPTSRLSPPRTTEGGCVNHVDRAPSSIPILPSTQPTCPPAPNTKHRGRPRPAGPASSWHAAARPSSVPPGGRAPEATRVPGARTGHGRASRGAYPTASASAPHNCTGARPPLPRGAWPPSFLYRRGTTWNPNPSRSQSLQAQGKREKAEAAAALHSPPSACLFVGSTRA